MMMMMMMDEIILLLRICLLYHFSFSKKDQTDPSVHISTCNEVVAIFGSFDFTDTDGLIMERKASVRLSSVIDLALNVF